VWALPLAAALFFTAPAASATAGFVLDLPFSPSAGPASVELRTLDDGELAQIQARGLVGVQSTRTGAKKKIILWDEGYNRNRAAQGPHMTPNTASASNSVSVSRRGGC
jgi:hypothetical protein